MNNYIKIIQGHYTAAKEHVENYGLKHKVTWIQAIKVTLYDCIFNKTIEIDGNYIVYGKLYKPHIGASTAFVISMYVKKENRGTGVMSKLLDMIDEDIVIGGYSNKDNKYLEIGKFVMFRNKNG